MSDPARSEAPPTRAALLQLAWPVVLAQTATALPGVVDTAVMGRSGDVPGLAAVAIAAVCFSFLYWSFGFLRMATTGLAARARGAGEHDEVRAVLLRALLLGAGLGVALWAARPLVYAAARAAFDAAPEVLVGVDGYIGARLFGAPAALCGFAINGWLLGVGRTRALLGYQLVLNGTNAALDAAFVGWLGLGAAGIGAGTAIAEWCALLVGLGLVAPALRGLPTGLWRRERWLPLFSANRDILLRTLALLSSFAWFTQASLRLGTATVAANQVLLQFIAVSAFVLDAFAFVTEKEAGEAVGRRSVARLRHVARRTTELALAAGVAFSALYLLTGPAILAAVLPDPEVRALATTYLPWCALVPLLGVPAWQLDGVFIGATRGATLRNAAVAATAAYIALDLALRPWGAHGLWGALVASYVLRAGALALGLPSLGRALRDQPD